MRETKIPLSCRVHPDLKFQIENEAYEANLTTSKYLENILKDRNTTAPNDNSPDKAWRELVRELELEKSELENANEELETGISELSRDYQQLKTDHEGQSSRLENLQQEIAQLKEGKENDSMAFPNFEPDDYDLFQTLLAKLHTAYPDLSDQELLLACLRTTLKNEESYFFIHQLGANIM